MELINQHSKKIMEGCKERALEAGLRFQKESLEYIVTNRDLLELSPKYMIPTLYDYWVHDVELLREKGKYELYPNNPYETVINTRPAISFYNDNNPDWLNVMIFYHVLAHIDFFQNNLFFRNTWNYDFTGEALSDKRLIAKLRAEKGRWVDYIIEFTRGIDNLVGFYHELALLNRPQETDGSKKLNYYFDVFLQAEKNVNITDYVKEIERYNECVKTHGAKGEKIFFSELNTPHPEFDALFDKHLKKKTDARPDIIQYLREYSDFLNKEENKWMQSVMEVVRKTSIFFQPQIRTKIMNEGWASYWHETLFLQDDRINGHEVEFARVNAKVTSMPRVGLNPYALGMRLFYFIEDMVNKGKYSIEYKKLLDQEKRIQYDTGAHNGTDFIFKIRENFSDFLFINTFVDQEFIGKNNLFVAGRRVNKKKMVWEYYVKSRKAEDYREMLFSMLYHPPRIEINGEKSTNNNLYLVHHFEEKPLVKEYIKNTMIGIEYLWGGPVKLETSDVASAAPAKEGGKPDINWERVLYTIEKRNLSRRKL